MTICSKLTMTATAAALVLLTQPAAAFTPIEGAEILSTPDSQISTRWQPQRAERGDTIWSACAPLAADWQTCLREFVLGANRDRFPAEMTSSADFFLTEGEVYLVPIADGVTPPASGETIAATGPTAAEWAAFLAEVEANDARMAALRADVDALGTELANLDLESLRTDVAGIGALRARLEALEGSIPDVSSLQAGLAQANAFIAMLQSGDLSGAAALQGAIESAVNTAIDQRFNELTAAGGLIDQRVATVVTETTSGIDDRLTAVEGNLGPLGKLPWWLWLPLVAGIILFLAGGIAWLVQRDVRRKVNDEETGLEATNQAVAVAHNDVKEVKDRLSAVESVLAVMVTHDMAGRYHCPDFTDQRLNDLKDGESIRLDVDGKGAIKYGVNVIMHRPADAAAYLLLQGVESGHDRIDAKKNGTFKVTQVYTALSNAERERKLIGLGESHAAAA